MATSEMKMEMTRIAISPFALGSRASGFLNCQRDICHCSFGLMTVAIAKIRMMPPITKNNQMGP